MKNILITIFLIQAMLTKAQTPNLSWVKSMGSNLSDIGNAIAIDVSGNIYSTGFFNGTSDFDPSAATNNLTSFGSSDVFISKLNSLGNFVWAFQVGGSGADVGNSITTDAAGNIYICGYFNGTTDFDPGAGVSNLTSFGGTDIFILKLNSSGSFIWARQLGGTGSDEGKSIALDASGNVHSTGSFSGSSDFNPSATTNNLLSSGSLDIFVSKLDASGNFVWAKNMGGIANDIGNSIAIDGSGNVCTTGNFGSMGDFDPGATSFSLTSAGAGDIFISKLDAAGNFVWAKQLGGSSNDVGNGLAIDASGNIFSSGYFFNSGDFDPGATTFTLTSAGVGDIFVSKLDASGNFVWAKSMGGPLDDFAHGIALDASGSIYTTGFFADTADFNPGIGTYTLVSVFPANPSLIRDQIFVSKLDPSGNFLWAGALGGIKGYGIATSSLNVYTTGYYTSTADFDPASSVFNLTTAGSDDIFIHKMTLSSVGINENLSPSEAKIFPNPTTGSFHISTTNIADVIIISDILGNVVMKILPLSDKEDVNLSSLTDGIYFVKIIANNTQNISKLVLSK